MTTPLFQPDVHSISAVVAVAVGVLLAPHLGVGPARLLRVPDLPVRAARAAHLPVRAGAPRVRRVQAQDRPLSHLQGPPHQGQVNAFYMLSFLIHPLNELKV